MRWVICSNFFIVDRLKLASNELTLAYMYKYILHQGVETALKWEGCSHQGGEVRNLFISVGYNTFFKAFGI